MQVLKSFELAGVRYEPGDEVAETDLTDVARKFLERKGCIEEKEQPTWQQSVLMK